MIPPKHDIEHDISQPNPHEPFLQSFFTCFCLFIFCCFSIPTPTIAVENIFYVDDPEHVISGPTAMVALDDGLSLAVINRLSQKISRIKHNQMVFHRSIDGFVPFDLLATNGDLYVSSKESGEVKVLSQIDFSLKKTIPVGESATFMALSSDQSTIYVAAPLDHADTIAMIDVATKSLHSPPIYDADLNLVEKLVSHGNRLYASNRITSDVVVFDETVIIDSPVQAKQATYNWGVIPDDLVFTNTHLYLSSMDEGKIAVIDLVTMEKLKELHFNGYPGKMLFDGKNTLYILNNDRTGKVYRLDTRTHTFDDEGCFLSGDCFYTGSTPEDAVISNDDKVLYVTNYRDDTVTYHFISGKLFIEPRTLIIKPMENGADPSSAATPDFENDGILLKAGGGSGSYHWSVPIDGGALSTASGEEIRFVPPTGEDIFTVTVTDPESGATAISQIIAADIRVTPERITIPTAEPVLFDITGGTPPYEVYSAQTGQGSVIDHKPGESTFYFTPPDEKGTYTLEIIDQNGAKAYATVKMAAISLPKEAAQAAIIITGGAPDPAQNPIWPQLESTTEKIYYMLTEEEKGLGIPENQVYLLAPTYVDGNGDNIPDIDILRNTPQTEDGSAIPLSVDDVEKAFDWATGLTNLDQPLLIFLLGHGGKDFFYLNFGNPMVKLNAVTLAESLDRFQEATGKPMVVVMDACHSGSFIDDLAGENRAIITSTGEENLAYYTTEGVMTIHSFSYKFAEKLSSPAPFYAKYEKICEELRDFYSRELCDIKVHIFQNPQFDDNGDGLAFDLLMEQKSDDGAMLKQICMQRANSLERRKKRRINAQSASLRSDEATSFISATTAGEESELSSSLLDQTLSVVSLNSKKKDREFLQTDVITLKAKTGIANGNVSQVYAVVKPPGMNFLPNGDTDDVSYLAYPRIPLEKWPDESENLESAHSEVWGTLWKEAVYEGAYEVNFMALTQNGGVAFSDGICFSVYDALPPPDKSSIDILFGDEASGVISEGNDSSPLVTPRLMPGDRLRVGVVEHLSWGYDFYCALALPDGTVLFITGFDSETGLPILDSQFVKWQDERQQESILSLMDFNIPMGFPEGSYTVFAAMVPPTTIQSPDKWVYSTKSFRFENE